MHGGFAAALQISQARLQDLILIFRRAGQLPAWQQGSVESPINPSGDGAAMLNFSLFMDVPEIECNSANGGLARIKLRFWGPLAIQAQGIDGFTREVELWLTVDTLLN